MTRRENVWLGAGLAGMLATAFAIAIAVPANAGASGMTCNDGEVASYVPISNGNSGSSSWAQTSNATGACGTVSHSAYVNQYGSWTYVPRGGYSSAQTIVSRTFYGTMSYSRHYHNGNLNTKLNN